MGNSAPPVWRRWVQGARLRTLPLALSPVFLGSSSAVQSGNFSVVLAALAALVALGLQVGVNYANDYSDGIRGTDDDRVGPARLVGSGAVEPRKVLRAALLSFGVAAVVGLVLLVVARVDVLATEGVLGWLAQVWPVVVAGALAVVAGWYYTGGSKPYGYSGAGELVVFVFFGPVATIGTAWAMTGFIPFDAVFSGVGAGSFAAAVLMVNNLRDREKDAVAGKNTLSVRWGYRASLWLLVVLVAVPYLMVGVLSLFFIWAPVAYLTSLLTLWVLIQVFLAKKPTQLIGALGALSMNAIAYGLVLGIALAW